jgi:Fur family transcriptional regulator, ferric uptake regulator
LPNESSIQTRSKEQAILDKIVAGGGRRTLSRQVVIRALVECHGHITVDEIAQKIQVDHPTVDVSTVYRTIETLRELEIVDRVHMGDGRAVYHLRDHEHHHLYCRSCGSVQEIATSTLSSLQDAVEARFGFELDPRPVSFVGLCRSCRRLQAGRPGG